jgi:hypothetical protein
MPKVVDLKGFQCLRCDHIWWPRDINKPPAVCPSCKNPYWDRPRQMENAKTAAAKKKRRAHARQ